jgi:hypothetical protein
VPHPVARRDPVLDVPRDILTVVDDDQAGLALE